MKPTVPSDGVPGLEADVLEYNHWDSFSSPGTVSLQHHLSDRLPLNLQQHFPEHFYTSATGRRYLRSTTLLCHYQVFNALSCRNLAGYSVQRMITPASLHGSLTSQDEKFELSSKPSFSCLEEPACYKNQGWPPQVYSTVHQIKLLSVAKTKGNSGSGIIAKVGHLLSTFKTI